MAPPPPPLARRSDGASPAMGRGESASVGVSDDAEAAGGEDGAGESSWNDAPAAPRHELGRTDEPMGSRRHPTATGGEDTDALAGAPPNPPGKNKPKNPNQTKNSPDCSERRDAADTDAAAADVADADEASTPRPVCWRRPARAAARPPTGEGEREEGMVARRRRQR